MRLETERLILRPWESRDRVPYIAMSADAEMARYFTGKLTAEQADSRIEGFQAGIARDGFGFLAAELRDTRALVGVIGIAKIDDETRAAIPSHPQVEIGWSLAPSMWGRGLAPEGARACLSYGWDTLGLD